MDVAELNILRFSSGVTRLDKIRRVWREITRGKTEVVCVMFSDEL